MQEIYVTEEDLFRLSPGANDDLVVNIVPILNELFSKYEINTKLRLVHFISQICFESAGFRTVVEYHDGSNYEGRTDLGNVNSGDGKKYRGRGLIQLTGRYNYRIFGEMLGVDFENNPYLVSENPRYAVEVSFAYWKKCKINRAADRDDGKAVTRIINGGLNGLDERMRLLRKAKEIFNTEDGKNTNLPTLHVWDSGIYVRKLQKRLKQFGYYENEKVDGVFGNNTREAVTKFQKEFGLSTDGVVGEMTWNALINNEPEDKENVDEKSIIRKIIDMLLELLNK